MKKVLIALVILLSGMTAHAQWFPMKDVNVGHFGLGVQGGAVGLGKEVTRAAFGANLMAYGVYLDFLYGGPQHRNDPKMDVWDDSSVFSIHIGYQIPVLEFLRIIPLVGYAELSKGVTDGRNYTLDYSNSSKRWLVNNKYTKDWKEGYLDAGGSVVVNLGPVSIFLTGTMCSVYGGVGWEF